jgi:hypothetical protein
VVSETAPGFGDTNNAAFTIFYGTFGIHQLWVGDTALNNFTWRGAWGQTYQVQCSTNLALTNGMAWVNAPMGAGTNQQPNFLSTRGGDFTYEDPQSTNNPYRAYRVILEQY